MSDSYGPDNPVHGAQRGGLEDLMERILAPAQPGAVFSAPVTAGDYLVITASEVIAGGGFGEGGAQESGQKDQERPPARAGGGGGGGGATGRPVAAIVISPAGVSVRPIVDVTKLGLVLLTTAAAMLAVWGKIRAQSRRT